jgi:NADPH-dependent 2,4-dienoyl-CoA reductase/sulfur reductase-like enzyme/pSer/pThr/pTyr-binding forkhead associated (FHA) protein
MAGRRYILVGDGAAGITAAQTLRMLDPQSQITMISDDPHPAYYRAALTNYLLGELRDEQVWAVPPTFFADYALERVHGRVQSIDAARSVVWTADGKQLSYDAVLVGSGARARLAPFEGANLPGVAVLRTLQDTRWVMDQIRLHGLRRAVVIGGGPLALEWALAMRERGVHVTMLVREAVFMGNALDEVASDLLAARLRSGIDVRLREEVAAVLPGHDGRVAAVRTKSGDTLPCEMVAVAIGVVPNVELLHGSAVSLGPRNGVAVNDRLRSSVPNVYAAGDVAEVMGSVVQLWEPARQQAKVAATNMVGRDMAYAPGVQYFATRLFDLDFASLGTIARAGQNADGSAAAGTQRDYVDAPRGGGKIAYRRLIVKDGRLIGALMLGDRASRVRLHGRLFKKLIDDRTDVSSIADQLLDPAFDLAGWIGRRALLEKPKDAAPASQIASPAEMRGTQLVRMGPGGPASMPRSAPKPASESASGTASSAPKTIAMPLQQAAAASQAPQTILSIGLKMPAPLSLKTAEKRAWIEGLGRRWDLGAAVVGIGRDPAQTIALQDGGVSSLHAQITVHDGVLFLRDLGSRNGTYVNGALVTVPHLLKDGDRIHVGNVDLVFRTEATNAALPVQPATPSAAPSAPSARPTSGTAYVEGRNGVFEGRKTMLSTSPATIGRDTASTIRIDDLTISRRHAVLNHAAGEWRLSDLASSTGTMHNGVRLAPGHEVALKDGDVLQLGNVVLVFRRL